MTTTSAGVLGTAFARAKARAAGRTIQVSIRFAGLYAANLGRTGAQISLVNPACSPTLSVPEHFPILILDSANVSEASVASVKLTIPLAQMLRLDTNTAWQMFPLKNVAVRVAAHDVATPYRLFDDPLPSACVARDWSSLRRIPSMSEIVPGGRLRNDWLTPDYSLSVMELSAGVFSGAAPLFDLVGAQLWDLGPHAGAPRALTDTLQCDLKANEVELVFSSRSGEPIGSVKLGPDLSGAPVDVVVSSLPTHGAPLGHRPSPVVDHFDAYYELLQDAPPPERRVLPLSLGSACRPRSASQDFEILRVRNFVDPVHCLGTRWP